MLSSLASEMLADPSVDQQEFSVEPSRQATSFSINVVSEFSNVSAEAPAG